jgi:acetyl esterase/lipase
LIASAAIGAEPKVYRDIAYAEPKNERLTLDVYAPREGKSHPLVVWVHGGGWHRGDKSEVQKKPQAFIDKGFVFVSINYRLFPHVTIKQIAGDVARSLRWTYDHAEEYGGDRGAIFIMGHSAGAQLVALVCTDDQYLKAVGLSLSAIKGCVPVDGDSYDVPMQIKAVEEGPAVSYTLHFGDEKTPKGLTMLTLVAKGKRAASFRLKFGDEQLQKELSAVKHVVQGKNIPPFLILHVADHPETKAQSQRLAKALQEAGVSAKAYPAEGKNHISIDADLGLPDDKPTQVLFEFVESLLKPRTLAFFKSNLDKTLTPAKAERVFGRPDRDIGSGLMIYEYGLDDGSIVWLGFPGFDRILYAKHVKKDGKVEELPLK